MKISFSGITWSVGGRRILDSLSLTAASGQFTGIVGPNGSGKSSLLRCLYRALLPDAGSIALDGQDIRVLSRRELATKLASVLQESLSECHFTVIEMVLMGRYPHHGAFSPMNEEDMNCARRAMQAADLCGLEDAPFQTLSGGEKQRVLIARALCQNSPALILDEPTNHLDIRHSLSLLGEIKRLRLTTLAVLHDLNLAASFCDQVFVLAQGKVAASGPPAQVFTPVLLRHVFGVEADVRTEGGTAQLRFLGPSSMASQP
ncbi:ABC transporter ATP-binding protein [Candidatus Electronema sp. JC]|uniref:ABC transporter ATP-binding protein n=1 Tax=Candidatus Electronema sp. JC TaxID=3401570 RepID=UPI003AA9866A